MTPRLRFVYLLVPLAVFAGSPPALAALWKDATAGTIGTTAEWSNKVELADVDGDGFVDVLFANGGAYNSKGTPEKNRVFRNQGPGEPFEEVTDLVFGPAPDLARVIKVRDLDGDGVADLVVGTAWSTQSRLFLGLGKGEFEEVTATHLPQKDLSVGDLEAGDVDLDGDLDLVLADWGFGNPQSNIGGRVKLWRNDGTAHFEDVSSTAMPADLVQWSWDLELEDVDNDLDLDVLVSCKSCTGSFLFVNDGTGHFEVAAGALPQFANNYDLEAMDLDGDAFLDLVTVNDGPGLKEHVFLNDGDGTFTDATATLWTGVNNPGHDDNVAAFVDFDSDGDADFVLGSLSGPDRLMVNDGKGKLAINAAVFSGASTPGTLGLALADLDGDSKIDVAMSQGEVASPDKVFQGADVLPDTAAPSITLAEAEAGGASESAAAVPEGDVLVRARVHDRKTPLALHDFESVTVHWTPPDASPESLPMSWYGGTLWRAVLPAPTAPGTPFSWHVCAADAAGNEACTDPATFTIPDEPPPDPEPLPVEPEPAADADPDIAAAEPEPAAEAAEPDAGEPEPLPDVAEPEPIPDVAAEPEPAADIVAPDLVEPDGAEPAPVPSPDVPAEPAPSPDAAAEPAPSADAGGDSTPDAAADPPPKKKGSGDCAGAPAGPLSLLPLLLALTLAARRRPV